MNTLKIVSLALVVAGISLAIGNPIYNALYAANENTAKSQILELLIVVAIDAIIYIVGLRLLKEDLVCSIFKRKGAKDE